MSKRLRLGILFGGRSAEHEVSLQSARNVMAAADPHKYEIVPIAISKEGRWRVGALPPGSPPLPALEGILKDGVEVIPAAGPAAAGSLIPIERNFSKDSSAPQFGQLDVIFPVLHGTF